MDETGEMKGRQRACGRGREYGQAEEAERMEGIKRVGQF